MTPPPGPAVLVIGGLAWNAANSIRARRHPEKPPPPIISRWACRNKKIAVPVAAAFSAWWVGHWVLYVIDDLTP